MAKNIPQSPTVQDCTYQLHIALEDMDPLIWRQLWIPSNLSLVKLDRVLQVAMGWTNSHLHEFEIAGKRYGHFNDEWPAGTVSMRFSRCSFTFGDCRNQAHTEHCVYLSRHSKSFGQISIGPAADSAATLVPLEHIMSECQALIEPLAQMRGIAISFPRMERPHWVDADRNRTKQVLINLLHNAIKYNEPGGVVSMTCTFTPPNSVRISVRDTGPGLSPEKLGQLFQPFNRLGRESGMEQGTGIGLVVVKQLVELMGGAIHVESQVGVGSVFSIELNLTTAPLLTAGETEQTVQHSQKVTHDTIRRTVLYVEDNPANLALVEELLTRRPDLRLISAVDGNLGVEYARSYLPEVILMDLHLPGISGIEAMKALRADPVTAHIPVVALSAQALPADIIKSMEAGFFNYITKPIKLDEFMAALDAALEFSNSKSSDAAVQASTTD